MVFRTAGVTALAALTAIAALVLGGLLVLIYLDAFAQLAR